MLNLRDSFPRFCVLSCLRIALAVAVFPLAGGTPASAESAIAEEVNAFLAAQRHLPFNVLYCGDGGRGYFFPFTTPADGSLTLFDETFAKQDGVATGRWWDGVLSIADENYSYTSPERIETGTCVDITDQIASYMTLFAQSEPAAFKAYLSGLTAGQATQDAMAKEQAADAVEAQAAIAERDAALRARDAALSTAATATATAAIAITRAESAQTDAEARARIAVAEAKRANDIVASGAGTTISLVEQKLRFAEAKLKNNALALKRERLENAALQAQIDRLKALIPDAGD